MRTKLTFVLIFAIAFSVACNKSKPVSFDAAGYKTEIARWQNDRLTNLKKEDSWLTLVGLYWLKEGENKFGSNADKRSRAAKRQGA